MILLETVDAAIPDFLSEAHCLRWYSALAVRHNRVLGEITVIFCSDEHLLEVNRKFLNHDYYTDIITFDYSEGTAVSGDLFISVDRVSDNATDLQSSFESEMIRVMAHGFLHLCGLGDKTDQETAQMRAAEDIAIDLFHVEHP